MIATRGFFDLIITRGYGGGEFITIGPMEIKIPLSSFLYFCVDFGLAKGGKIMKRISDLLYMDL